MRKRGIESLGNKVNQSSVEQTKIEHDFDEDGYEGSED